MAMVQKWQTSCGQTAIGVTLIDSKIKPHTMEIPPNLLEQVRQHQVVLFLGAGASIDARNSSGDRPPNGTELAKLISQKFLGGMYDAASLSEVAEYAASEASLLAVQHFIKELFEPFQPSPAHKLMTKFMWHTLATTNYDLLVERAYALESQALQVPVSFVENGDQVVDRLRDPKSVQYLKLHGCITRISNDQCPLILSMDQYLQYQKGRDRLFMRLREMAYEHTIVFVGHRGQDPDIRETILHLDAQAGSRPRFFAVLPNRNQIEKRAWENKRVTILDGTFEDFLKALDSSMTEGFRGLQIPTAEAHPISHRFRVTGEALSKNCSEFLGSDAAYVKSHNATERTTALDFYRGYMGGWSAIEQSLDISRDFTDDLITDVILIDDLQKKKPIELVLIKGYAGSGKTVSLRRIAWDGAHDYERLCIYMDDAAHVNIGAIQEIIELCQERVFLFIDNAQDRSSDIRKLVNEIGDQGQLLTIVAATRSNEWNSVPGDIQASVTAEYEITPLNRKEIGHLLAKLEAHNALGRLASKSLDERLHEFEIAGRQLLVALHEATMGVPFEEILENEYNKLSPIQAQQVYLTICILNRLGVPVRAGLISRIHNLPFDEFKDRLFRPLEHIVYSTFDKRLRDNVFRARHVIIADIVFDRILRKQEERFAEYFRTLTALNVDFSTDSDAFRQMVKGRVVAKLFSNHDYCEEIYEAAFQMVGDEPNLLQQRALYEMHRPNANLSKASSLISRAVELQPYNKAFKHTKAELALKKADAARTPLERDKFLMEASGLATETKGGRFGETHSHHTLAKVQIKRLEAAIAEGDGDFSSPAMQSIVRSVEAEILQGLQGKPGDSYLLTEQAKLAQLLRDSPRMLESLAKAFSHNTKLGYLAVQLAACLMSSNKRDDAKKVLETALQANRNDKSLNYRYALFLTEANGAPADIAYYLKRAFSPGDQNYDAQLRYCRALFINSDFDLLRQEFATLRNAKTPPFLRNDELYFAPNPVQGIVNGLRHSHVFATESRSQLNVLIPRVEVRPETWVLLTEGARVEFNVGVTFRGLLGTNCIRL